MGIDIKVISKTDEIWNGELGSNKNCKYAWRNINWEKIFELISFNITILFDNNPNYWSNDHLKDILSLLIKLKNKDSEFYNHDESYYFQCEDYNDELNDDLDKLINIFTEYVNKNCIIIIH